MCYLTCGAIPCTSRDGRDPIPTWDGYRWWWKVMNVSPDSMFGGRPVLSTSAGLTRSQRCSLRPAQCRIGAKVYWTAEWERSRLFYDLNRSSSYTTSLVTRSENRILPHPQFEYNRVRMRQLSKRSVCTFLGKWSVLEILADLCV